MLPKTVLRPVIMSFAICAKPSFICVVVLI
nr:MAG TPA: hypothetical protein [Caudoviricetes sp.]